MKHFMKGVLCAIAPLLATSAFAAQYKVTGLVADSTGNPESFATVRIFLLPDTVKPKTSGLAGEDGKFDIPLPITGSYKVNILSFGKSDTNREIRISDSEPTANLGLIRLSDSPSLLEEVVVTAQRPLVSKEIDRIGYDVQADSESKTSQLDEILKKVPLVSVEADGTIKVKGSTSFKIYKNGRPNNSFTKNAKDIFKAIPASMIKKIEVITEPGAREDAEGTNAILNIVTIDNTVIKGVMGNVGLNYRTPSIIAPNIWLSSQIDKVTLSLYGGANFMSERDNKSRSESLTRYEDSGNELKSSSESDGKGYFSWAGIDASYELDSLNLFTAEFGGYIYDIHSNSHGHTAMKDINGNDIYSYSTISRSKPNRYFDFNGGFNYQRSTRKKGETIILSYLLSTTNQKQESTTGYEDQISMPVPYSGLENNFSLNFIEHTGQIDWTRPINDHNKFDIGSKYINRRNHSINDIDYFDYRSEHSDFTHITQVLAFYFDYRLNLKKFGARAGIRYEYSHLSAKYKDGSNDPFSSNLSDWVPNVAFSYNINDANTLKISYSTRINRPGISQLNPAVIESPSSVSSGNPDLESSRNQNINLNYNLIGRKLNLDFNASYNFSNNAVISVQELLDGDILKSGYANAGRNRRVNLSVWLNYSPGAKTSFMVNANANYSYSANHSLNVSASGWGMNTFVRIRQQLPWGLDASAYWSAYQPGPSLYSKNTCSFGDMMHYGIDLQKSFLKERRLNVRLGISNPFGKSMRGYSSEPVNAGYTGYSRNWSYYASNNISIGISYRFGSLNAQVKKTAKSISNDDVENRKN